MGIWQRLVTESPLFVKDYKVSSLTTLGSSEDKKEKYQNDNKNPFYTLVEIFVILLFSFFLFLVFLIIINNGSLWNRFNSFESFLVSNNV
jgi:quinol-cytochrome oxidoreductase complex cytochrome b subunit